MVADDNDYLRRLRETEPRLLEYLRTFEVIQENLRLGAVKESQERLLQATGDTFRRLAPFAELEAPAQWREFHLRFRQAAALLERSLTLFLTRANPQWTLAFLNSRAHFCQALYLFYELRRELPCLGQYFVSEGATCPADASFADATADGVPVGFI
ncbi:MAG: hypothetical protein ACREQE_09380, partial [Candidatus Binataceae bacterium]